LLHFRAVANLYAAFVIFLASTDNALLLLLLTWLKVIALEHHQNTLVTPYSWSGGGSIDLEQFLGSDLNSASTLTFYYFPFCKKSCNSDLTVLA
jgi:hypothetical protein